MPTENSTQTAKPLFRTAGDAALTAKDLSLCVWRRKSYPVPRRNAGAHGRVRRAYRRKTAAAKARSQSCSSRAFSTTIRSSCSTSPPQTSIKPPVVMFEALKQVCKDKICIIVTHDASIPEKVRPRAKIEKQVTH